MRKDRFMKKCAIPKTNLITSDLCLGTNVFGWSADEATSKRVLSAFVDGGGNFIDTADKYSDWFPGNVGGESERIIGNWLHETKNRDQVVIATKVAKYPQRLGLSRENIFAAIDDSLKRMQTDYIDIYYAHTDDLKIPLEESLAAFTELITKGKVKYIAASNYSATRLQKALDVSEKEGLASYVAIQNQYNLMERDEHEKDLLPIVSRYGISAIPYYGLAKGFLTGKYQPGASIDSLRAESVKPYLNERGWKTIQTLSEIATRRNSSISAVALAWLRNQPGVSVPIASARTENQLQELITPVELTVEEIEKLSI